MADKPLEVKEGILLDRDGAEIPRPESPRSAGARGRPREVPLSEFIFNRTEGSAARIFQLGPVAKFFLVLAIPVFLILGIALVGFFIVGAMVSMVLRTVLRLLGLIR